MVYPFRNTLVKEHELRFYHFHYYFNNLKIKCLYRFYIPQILSRQETRAKSSYGLLSYENKSETMIELGRTVSRGDYHSLSHSCDTGERAQEFQKVLLTILVMIGDHR